MGRSSGQPPPLGTAPSLDWDLSQRLSDAAITNANQAFNMLLLLNGGAAVAVLALAGEFVTADTIELRDALPAFASALTAFAWGAAAAVLGMVISYLANSSFAQAAVTFDAAPRRSWEKRGLALLLLGVASAAGSLGLFGYAIHSIRPAFLATGF